jgi:hypothetical protein
MRRDDAAGNISASIMILLLGAELADILLPTMAARSERTD